MSSNYLKLLKNSLPGGARKAKGIEATDPSKTNLKLKVIKDTMKLKDGYEKKRDFSNATTIKLGGEGNPQEIEGFFLGSKDVQNEYGPGKLHFFDTENGVMGVWGKKRLDSLLTPNTVGYCLHVIYTGRGEKQKGKQPPYLFEVGVDWKNKIDVSNIDLSPIPAAEDDSEGTTDDGVSESSYADEAPYTPPVAPKAAAKAPDAARQAKVAALLNGTRNKQTA